MAHRFNLTIKLGNAEMQTPAQIAAALDEIRVALERLEVAGPPDEPTFNGDGAIFDLNGNRVGEWSVIDDAEQIEQAAERIRALNRRLAARDGDGYRASPEDQAKAALNITR